MYDAKETILQHLKVVLQGQYKAHCVVCDQGTLYITFATVPELDKCWEHWREVTVSERPLPFEQALFVHCGRVLRKTRIMTQKRIGQ